MTRAVTHILALVTVAAFLALPHADARAATFRGVTSQGRAATVVASHDGTVRMVRVRWRARCSAIPGGFREATTFDDPYASQTPSLITDHASYDRHRGAAVVHVAVDLVARRATSRRWQGTVRASAVFRTGGQTIARCLLRTVQWDAAVPDAALELTSDNGDAIGNGGSYVFSTPADDIRVDGDQRTLTVVSGAWTAEVQAPSGRALTAGTFDVSRYPFNGARGGLNVSVGGRECDALTGQVTITASSFGRDQRPRSLALSFVQHCDGAGAALRGRISYRAP